MSKHLCPQDTNLSAHFLNVAYAFFGVPPTEKPEKKLSWMELYQSLYGKHPKLCPCCNNGIMVAVEIFLPKHLLPNRDEPQMMPNLAFCEQK
jgi:hypothetical protein